MSTLAPALQAFFTDRLIRQRQASPHTIAAYRDTFKLLPAYALLHTGLAPSRPRIEDLDASLIGAFLTHLETERGNSARTRNARLAAIHSSCVSRHSAGSASTPGASERSSMRRWSCSATRTTEPGDLTQRDQRLPGKAH